MFGKKAMAIALAQAEQGRRYWKKEWEDQQTFYRGRRDQFYAQVESGDTTIKGLTKKAKSLEDKLKHAKESTKELQHLVDRKETQLSATDARIGLFERMVLPPTYEEFEGQVDYRSLVDIPEGQLCSGDGLVRCTEWEDTSRWFVPQGGYGRYAPKAWFSTYAGDACEHRWFRLSKDEVGEV